MECILAEFIEERTEKEMMRRRRGAWRRSFEESASASGDLRCEAPFARPSRGAKAEGGEGNFQRTVAVVIEVTFEKRLLIPRIASIH